MLEDFLMMDRYSSKVKSVIMKLCFLDYFGCSPPQEFKSAFKQFFFNANFECG